MIISAANRSASRPVEPALTGGHGVGDRAPHRLGQGPIKINIEVQGRDQATQEGVARADREGSPSG